MTSLLSPFFVRLFSFFSPLLPYFIPLYFPVLHFSLCFVFHTVISSFFVAIFSPRESSSLAIYPCLPWLSFVFQHFLFSPFDVPNGARLPPLACYNVNAVYKGTRHSPLLPSNLGSL